VGMKRDDDRFAGNFDCLRFHQLYDLPVPAMDPVKCSDRDQRICKNRQPLYVVMNSHIKIGAKLPENLLMEYW